MSDPSQLGEGHGPGTDPDLILPPAVRRAAAEAERLAAEATAQAQAEQGGEGGAPADTPVVSSDTTPGFDHSVPEPVVYTPKSETQAPARDENQSQRGRGDGQDRSTERDASYWEHRCRTLQGKYDSEVPSLNARLRAVEGEAGELRNQLYQARMAYNPGQNGSGQGRPTQGPVTADIPEEDIEAYGQDFIEKVRGWTRPVVDPEINQLKQKVERIENLTASQRQEVLQQGVRDYLSRRIPNWEEINSHPTFLEWVQRPDPFSGVNRLELMRQAFTGGDASRTGAFFEAFLTEHTAVQPPGTRQAHNPVYSGAGSVPLAELTAPGRGRPGSAPGASDKPDFTHRQIDQFYADVARGKYQYNEAEKVRIEKLIHVAAAENRIR